jgi:hypothetical protein
MASCGAGAFTAQIPYKFNAGEKCTSTVTIHNNKQQSMIWRDSAMQQIVAYYHRISMVQQFASLPSLSTTHNE